MTAIVQVVAAPDATSPGSDREVKALAEAEGLKLVAITLRRGIELPDHVAPGPITIQVMTGRVTLVAGGEVHDLAPGQVAMVPAGVHHALRPIGEEPVLVLLNRCSAPGSTS